MVIRKCRDDAARARFASVAKFHLFVATVVVCAVMDLNSFGSTRCMTISSEIFAALRHSRATLRKRNNKPKVYKPSKIEKDFLDHGTEFGLNDRKNPSSGCSKWTDPNSPLAPEFDAFRQGMKNYKENLQDMFEREDRVKDLRKELRRRTTTQPVIGWNYILRA